MNTTGKLSVRRVEDAEPRTHNSVTARPLFDRRNDPFRGSTSYCWHTTIAAGEANAAHVHDDIEKIYYVLSGRAHVVCGDESTNVTQGESFFFPAQIEHSIANAGESELQMLVYAAKILPEGSTL